MLAGGIVPAVPPAFWGEGEIMATTGWAPVPIGIAAVVSEQMLVIGEDDWLTHRLERDVVEFFIGN